MANFAADASESAMAILTSLPRSIEVVGLLRISLRALLLRQGRGNIQGTLLLFWDREFRASVSHCVFVVAFSTEFEPTIHLL